MRKCYRNCYLITKIKMHGRLSRRCRRSQWRRCNLGSTSRMKSSFQGHRHSMTSSPPKSLTSYPIDLPNTYKIQDKAEVVRPETRRGHNIDHDEQLSRELSIRKPVWPFLPCSNQNGLQESGRGVHQTSEKEPSGERSSKSAE